MNIEQEREDFETCHVKLFGKKPLRQVNSDKYVYDSHQSRWGIWRARAALQSQDREDAERWRAMKERSVVTFMNDSGRKLMIATVEIGEFPKPLTMDGFIDHARRVEGEGK